MGEMEPTRSYPIVPRAAPSSRRSRKRLSPLPARTTRRRIPATFITSSAKDAYAALSKPIVNAEVTIAVGIRPVVVKS